ncbi:MAG: hypothetical protein ACC657_14020 [Thiohalomonadales bacterium]
MNPFIEIFQGLPVILLIAFIFGLVALIRIFIINTPGIQRESKRDRRQSTKIPSFPLHDNKINLIFEDRRKCDNRRLASHASTNYCVVHWT